MIQMNNGRRRSPPIVIWLILGLLIGSVVVCLVMGLVAWREAEQIQALQTEVGSLQSERQETNQILAAMQGTATVMENRVALLEANDPAQQLAALEAALESATDAEELGALRASYLEIQTEVDSFQSTLDELIARMAALEPANTAANLPSEVRLSVGRQRQSHNLSCESSAASMAAQYHGFNISEADILAALPLNDNPHLGFRGNVDGPTGGIEDYGVYATPILDALNSQGLHVWPVGGGVDGIKAAIARGNPVIAWVPYDCSISVPVETVIDGETVTLVPNQHVIVITGYDAQGVWANDPWDGLEDYYSYADLVRAMSYFDDMALEIAAP